MGSLRPGLSADAAAVFHWSSDGSRGHVLLVGYGAEARRGDLLMVGRISSPRFVGRVKELDALERLLSGASDGRGSAVLVAGAAEIPVDRTRGPFRTVSGDANAMSPSTPMGEIVERRAKERGFAHDVTHLRYSDAGHPMPACPAPPVAAEVRHPLTHCSPSFQGGIGQTPTRAQRILPHPRNPLHGRQLRSTALPCRGSRFPSSAF